MSMCGIFAAANCQSVTNSLLHGLNALSYRGYDSSGIAINGLNGLERRRAKGKVNNLEDVIESLPISGTTGIAHTRWATHGMPTKRNAHPHMTERVAVVHNGIIENHAELRCELEEKGYTFSSDTDSETIPLLITHFLDEGDDEQSALLHAVDKLEGSYAIVAIFDNNQNELFAAKKGSPLIIGQSDDASYLSSDANAFNGVDRLSHMKDGDIANVTSTTVCITNSKGIVVNREKKVQSFSYSKSEKNGYRHYMLKEIHEQPESFARTFSYYLDKQKNTINMPDLSVDFKTLPRLSIIACGTSYFAATIAKYWLESIAGLPVDIEVASEYLYRDAPTSSDNAALFISQSGETADTLSALRYCKALKQKCISIVNVENSSMSVESDIVLPTLAGPEIGVASTKAFTAQLAVLAAFTIKAAYERSKITHDEQLKLVNKFSSIPELFKTISNVSDQIEQVARRIYTSDNILYLGRGTSYPVAQEGALKLKEISYIHAEAYPAGELKHGPIALLDENLPVVFIAPPDSLLVKSLSNLREVASRGAKVILISSEEGVEQVKDYIDSAIILPEVHPMLNPVLYTLPLQFLAYHVAVLKGTDIDQPRNLAKSVTVE